MSEMPEMIWAKATDNYWSELDAGCEFLPYTRADIVAEMLKLAPPSPIAVTPETAELLNTNMLAEKDAEIERLRRALDQAIGAASLSLNENIGGSNSYAGYGMWALRSEPTGAFVYGQSATEFFFGCYSEDAPDLAAYLREKEDRNGS